MGRTPRVLRRGRSGLRSRTVVPVDRIGPWGVVVGIGERPVHGDRAEQDRLVAAGVHDRGMVLRRCGAGDREAHRGRVARSDRDRLRIGAAHAAVGRDRAEPHRMVPDVEAVERDGAARRDRLSPAVHGHGVARRQVAAAGRLGPVCALPPVTVRSVGTSPGGAVWFPALGPTNVPVPGAAIALGVPPPPLTDTVYPDAGGLAGVFVVTVNAPVVGGGAMMLNGSLNLLRGPALASSVYPCPGVSSDRFVNVATPFTGCVFFVPFRVSLPGLSCRVTTTVTVSTPATGFPAESTILTCTGPIGRPACTDRGGVVNARPTGVPWEGGGEPPPDPPSSLSRWQPTASAPSARTRSVFVIIGRACCKCRT